MRNHADIYETTLLDFRDHLKLERSMSPNTITAYTSDIRKFFDLLRSDGIAPADAGTEEIDRFLESQVAAGVTKRSQARIISSVKALYRFLDAEGKLSENPCDRIAAPKINPYLPTVLSVKEVLSILDSVDLSKPEGHRNRAILEVLYSCGLRVSELVNLKISDLFLDEQFVRVFGKGSKQRLVPIGEPAIQAIRLYREIRDAGPVKKADEDILFLNRNGGKLTRGMIFHIVRNRPPPPASARKSPRIHSATVSPRTWSKTEPTCASSRRCSATRASSPPRSTPTSTPASGRKPS